MQLLFYLCILIIVNFLFHTNINQIIVVLEKASDENYVSNFI